MSRAQVWSSGGGVQSAAVAALIVRGDIEPPALSAIVDVGREARTTWAYMDSVITPALAGVGVVLHRVLKSDFATVDLYRGEELLIPAFTDQNGSIGKLPTYCSNEWKRRVLQRWARSRLPDETGFDVWIGISTDEMKRTRQDIGKWENRYPLIEKRLNRGDCLALVERMGWPAPPRSSCWMCPNRGAAEWDFLRENDPEEFELACEFEREIRKKDEGLWLTREGVNLSELKESKKTGDLFLGRCDSGFCFT